MTAAEKITAAGYEDVVLFEDYSYDDALVGVTECGRAVYDFEKMVEWLVKRTGRCREEAIEWVYYNTVRAQPYAGDTGPLIMYKLQEEVEVCG